jgi:hypothetical protein
MLRMAILPPGFIAPCLPTKTDTLPSGGLWLHEIKHDGFRIIARKDGAEVKLYSRPGNDFTRRFPLIIEALARLRSQSCIIDGEAVACGDDGVPSFDRIRYRRHDGDVFLYAFDLIELNGDDMRRDPLEVRKATLRSVLAKAGPGLRFNEHFGRRRPDRLCSCVQDGTRRYRVEAQGLALSLGALASLAQDEELGSTGSEARGRRGLGKVMPLVAKNPAVLYRQRAQECLDLARTLTFGTERQVLIDMAQTWLELAEEQEAAMPSGSYQPVMQQQQQAQPKNDDKKE